MASPLDPFVPIYDARERFQVRVQAPARLVFDTGAGFDLQSIPLVRAIFWLRGRFLRAAAPASWKSEGFLRDAPRMGWGILREEPGRLFVAGAHCQPWLPDVVFVPLSPGDFLGYAVPGQVKIAWSLEADSLEEPRSRLTTETRAVATDAETRRRFLRYWRWARFGIYPIRWLLLTAIRRQAERRYHRLRSGDASPDG
jgi:hypothetical protein